MNYLTSFPVDDHVKLSLTEGQQIKHSHVVHTMLTDHGKVLAAVIQSTALSKLFLQ